VRLTDLQEDVSIVGWNDVSRYTYAARQAVITGLKSHSSMGVEVDEQEIEINYADDALFQNWKSWPESLLSGGSTARRSAETWRSRQAGTIPGRASRGCSLAVTPNWIRSAARPPSSRSVPGLRGSTSRCRAISMGSSAGSRSASVACGIDLNALAVLGTVGVGATRTTIPWTRISSAIRSASSTSPTATRVTRVRTILAADATNLYLKYPLDFDPAAGLEFTAFPGCSHLHGGQRLPDLLGLGLAAALRRLSLHARCRDRGLA
jgi:hypothetical protein